MTSENLWSCAAETTAYDHRLLGSAARPTPPADLWCCAVETAAHDHRLPGCGVDDVGIGR
jgi:hypothetical protein